jgi:hypothetical protein
MAQVVLIGIPGEDGLWLADLVKGSVTPLEGGLSGNLAAVESVRQAGGTVMKDVDFAVAVSSASEIASGFLEG